MPYQIAAQRWDEKEHHLHQEMERETDPVKKEALMQRWRSAFRLSQALIEQYEERGERYCGY